MGIAYSILNEGLPPKSKFSVDDIPDLSGKVAIVTGANTGLGKETAKALLQHNARVYVAARSKAKAEAAIQDLKDATGKEPVFLELDLADLGSVRKAAEEFKSKEPQLHMLFNNAGVMVPPVEQLTKQGYDLQFGTNVLGHFYFTKLLLPTLLSTASSAPKPQSKPRIINTSSSGSYFVSTLDFGTFADTPARKALGTNRLYAQSKLGNVVFSNELARRYGAEGLVSVSLNPGNLKSDLQRHLRGVQEWFVSLMLYPTPFGALTQLWAGTSEEGASMNGKYLIPWARYGKPNSAALDEKLGRDLWAWLEEQVEKYEKANGLA